ncbi:MAG: ABC transporter ATP-binding protein [Caldilineaceae bacterium]|nr:ABC transporter ATP-binding protein [Caldilineaceae bacterium]
MSDSYALEMRQITKRFPGTLANDRVDFTAREGEIHALLGENGAGKSTLMNVLTGLYHPDEGEIYINGRRFRFNSPGDAIAAGVGMVHQHFMLVPNQTVAENVILGLRDVPFRLNGRRIEENVQAISEQYGLPIDPRAKIWQLSVGEQQRVEIIKVLYRGAQILILDEPTAVLTPQETEGFFATLDEMRRQGKTIIFISHKLDEVLSIADRITVLRHGANVATVDAAGMTKPELASLMVGRPVLFHIDKPECKPGEPRLLLDGISALDNKGLTALNRLSLTVRSGEIVGVAGVAGNGQRELAEVICGLRATTGGVIDIGQNNVADAPPIVVINAGVAYVPEDRGAVGTAPNLSVAENMALKAYRKPPIGSGLFMDRRLMREQAAELIKRFDISTPGPLTPVRKLSGGNLQKVILAREISSNPRVIIAAYPTRGLDIGATENVRNILVDERSNGTAILLISEDLDEIFALSDRIAVLYEGEVAGVVPGEQADRDAVGLMMAGETPEAETAPAVTTPHTEAAPS